MLYVHQTTLKNRELGTNNYRYYYMPISGHPALTEPAGEATSGPKPAVEATSGPKPAGEATSGPKPVVQNHFKECMVHWP